MSIRTAFAVFLACISCVLMFASSAFARWFIEGEELKSTAALSSAIKVDEASALKVPALNLKIVCGGGTLDAAKSALNSGESLAGSLQEELPAQLVEGLE
jgi:hypothetical protein